MTEDSSMTFWWRRAKEAESRIEQVRKVHRKVPVCETADDCPDTSGEHHESRHVEADEVCEYICLDRPLYEACEKCRDENGELMFWPCETIKTLDGVV